MVFVLDINRKPLLPCHEAVARKEVVILRRCLKYAIPPRAKPVSLARICEF